MSRSIPEGTASEADESTENHLPIGSYHERFR